MQAITERLVVTHQMPSFSVQQLLAATKPYALPLVLLCLAWSNLNSGFWQVQTLDTPLQMAHAFRAVMPYVLPLIGLGFWVQAKPLHHRLNPVAWLVGYGFLALGASVLSPSFEPSFYFGMAFMMNLLVPAAFFTLRYRTSIRPEVVLLVATWLILGVYVVAIYVLLRDQLGVGYGVASQIGNVTRSSGLARFFGVAGLLCFARIWQGHGHWKWSLAVPLAFCAWVVWSMQSRGGMFGFFAGMLLLLFLSRNSWRAYCLVALVSVSLLAAGQYEPLMKKVTQQVTRGQDVEQLQSMTGRTHFYAKSWPVIQEHPIIGQGHWADRLSAVGGHVHNSYLQALLNAGFVGFVPYMASWILGWWLFYRLYQRRAEMLPGDRLLFMEAGAVMMFFTVRSIPETTTASFSVDSMLMIPVYLYLFVLYQRMSGAWNPQQTA